MYNQSKPLAKGKGLVSLAVFLVGLSVAGYFGVDAVGSWLYGTGESFSISKVHDLTSGLFARDKVEVATASPVVRTGPTRLSQASQSGQVLGAVKAVEDNITEDSLVFRLRVFFLEAIEAASARFDTDLEVGNDTVIGNDLEVGNDAEVTNNLTVGGELILADANVSNNAFIGNLLEVISSITAGGDLAVGGVIVGESDLEIGGTITGNGDLDVGGTVTSGGDLEVGGDATIDGDTTVGGDLTVEGELIAPNVVYSITAGDGISVSGDQDVTITNSDRGSSQFIFKNFVFDGTTISATTNDDTLTFVPDTGITFSTSGKTVTIGVDSDAVNTSGWVDDGTVVRLDTISDNVGIGTTTSTYKLRVEGTGYFSGATTIAGGLTVQSGLNNSSGGITNAGSITGATGFTSSGTITFSDFSTGILHSNVNGVISVSALNLAGGSTEVTGTLPVTNGGTGITGVNTGDILYATASNTLGTLGIGSEGEVLIVSSGVPEWGVITGGSGGICSNCVVTDPGSTQTISPTSATATGLVVRQASGGSVDVFSVQNSDGTDIYFRVDSSGNVVLGDNTTSGTFTVSPANTDPISIDPAAQGAGEFTGTITSQDLTTNRTWTFPDSSGIVCLASGNCSGTSAAVDGSGTTNYLAKWDDTFSLTTSLIYDDNTNVGIGTITMSALLDVAGTLNVDELVTLGDDLNVTAHATISGSLRTDQAVDFNSTLGVSGATTLGSTLDVTGLATFGGNVGIGTASPTSKLQVAGNVYPTADNAFNLGSPSLRWANVYSANDIVSPGLSDADGDTKIQVEESADDDTIRFDTAGVERMLISSGGNVGIGTTKPGAPLDVNGTIYFGSQIVARADTDTRFVFSNNQIELQAGGLRLLTASQTSAFTGNVTGNLNSHNVDFIWNGDINGSSFFYLDADVERVGIGTSSPTSPLTVLKTNTSGSGDFIGNLTDVSQSVSGALTTYAYRAIARATHTSGTLSGIQANSTQAFFSGSGGTTSFGEVLTSFA